MDKRSIAILGSTGSIGTQTLDVISRHKERFEVEVITAQNNAELLIEQGRSFNPNCVVIGNEGLYDQVFQALDPLGIKVYSGEKALASVVEMDSIDVVLTALVGYAGLLPTINAIKSGKTIALANKEALVVAGGLITKLARKHGVNILPVDSEHSAIFQCLVGEFHNPIEKLILTASGGPFRGRDRAFCADVKKEQALKHPNWDMGAKITIDSATMMNKGLEVIEAKWLFAVNFDQIEVIVHPQSVIHSMVQFKDASMKAQMGLPDMRVPIQFAIGYPKRFYADFPRFNFLDYPHLTFEKPDMETFRNLALAFEVGKKGGNLPCILNAANEIAVQGFLEDRVGFLEISDVIESCIGKVDYIRNPLLEDFIETDRETRAKALELIR
ncbi:MAG: 1-deoxy-D-xylulose-5-phosphate reductoisomerase [Ekhidna sp.]|nr:1-deoxy-D-xylulose-5-phosphate reductoisomerase [Ekhidna sp.]